MSGLVLLGLLWAAVGISLGIRWWSEREQAPGHHAARDGTVPGPVVRTRFGRLAESREEHRRQAMRLAYATGACVVAVGFWTTAGVLLALGAAFVNLGTIYRHLVLLVDEAPPDEPVPARPAHRRRTRPAVVNVLLGDP